MKELDKIAFLQRLKPNFLKEKQTEAFFKGYKPKFLFDTTKKGV